MSFINNSSVPQGFSVFQAALGEPLQFLPALGTQLLDDLINAYIPGPESLQQKRTQVSMEFFSHFQLTGQSHKWFTVVTPSTGSPLMMASPAQGSSSFTVSPVASDWDWSSISGQTPAGSSRSSHAGSSRKASARNSTPSDFSHMPGMKIMTKDGIDVTNSASRGSKTKEQRDHAHLMRIIKACDSCKKKKIRCDPSHKKRTAGAAAASPVTKPSKRVKVTAAAPVASRKQPVAAPSPLGNTLPPPAAPSLDFDSSFSFDSLLENNAMPEDSTSSWEDFLHFPQDMDDSYDFFFDPQGFLSSPSLSDASPVSSSASSKPISPTTQNILATGDVEGLQRPTNATFATGEMFPADVPVLPYLDVAGGSSNYTDFNLYSPASNFSEDERMLSVASSTPSTLADGTHLLQSPDDWSHAPREDLILGGEFASESGSGQHSRHEMRDHGPVHLDGQCIGARVLGESGPASADEQCRKLHEMGESSTDAPAQIQSCGLCASHTESQSASIDGDISSSNTDVWGSTTAESLGTQAIDARSAHVESVGAQQLRDNQTFQDVLLPGDSSVNAIDRHSLHNSGLHTRNKSTVPMTSSAASTLNAHEAVRKNFSHDQSSATAGDAHAQVHSQSTTTSSGILQSTPDTVFSSRILSSRVVGTDQRLSMVTARSTTTDVTATVSHSTALGAAGRAPLSSYPSVPLAAEDSSYNGVTAASNDLGVEMNRVSSITAAVVASEQQTRSSDVSARNVHRHRSDVPSSAERVPPADDAFYGENRTMIRAACATVEATRDASSRQLRDQGCGLSPVLLSSLQEPLGSDVELRPAFETCWDKLATAIGSPTSALLGVCLAMFLLATVASIGNSCWILLTTLAVVAGANPDVLSTKGRTPGFSSLFPFLIEVDSPPTPSRTSRRGA